MSTTKTLITLTNSDALCYVDEDDAARVLACRWRLLNNGYVITGFVENRPSKTQQDTTALLHRFILNLPRGRRPVVDHIDRNPLNNVRSNLRIVTQVENLRNCRDYREDMPKGVYLMKGGLFRAMVRNYGKLVHIGVFDTKEEAAAARAAWEQANWGVK